MFLLLQKEKDLELTARIGKELLANNQRLENNVASLEGELRTTNEKLTQLSHELLKKTELIQVSTKDHTYPCLHDVTSFLNSLRFHFFFRFLPMMKGTVAQRWAHHARISPGKSVPSSCNGEYKCLKQTMFAYGRNSIKLPKTLQNVRRQKRSLCVTSPTNCVSK